MACVAKVAVAVAGSLVPVPGRSYEHTRARSEMAGSTFAQPSEPASNPAINSTVVAPRPVHRTCTRAPWTPTSSSIVAVGRAAIAAVVLVLTSTVVWSWSSRWPASGRVWPAAALGSSPPQALALKTNALRIATPERRWRNVTSNQRFEAALMLAALTVLVVVFMGPVFRGRGRRATVCRRVMETVLLRRGCTHRPPHLRSATVGRRWIGPISGRGRLGAMALDRFPAEDFVGPSAEPARFGRRRPSDTAIDSTKREDTT